MKKLSSKKGVSQILQFVGLLLSVIALIFVARSFWSQRTLLLTLDLYKVFLVVLSAGFVYLLANFFLVAAWWMLLKWFREDRLSFVANVGIYGRSQILKYIPGNIFSLPGRHLLSRQYGLNHGPLIGAATFEIAGLLAASSFISISGFLLAPGNISQISLPGAWGVLLLTLVAPLIAKYIFTRQVVLQRIPFLQTINWGNYSGLMVIWLIYLSFFALIGLVLAWVLSVLGAEWGAVPLVIVLSTYGISWLLGLITPGAPAGAGIREGVMILLLAKYIGEPHSVLISIVMRVITMLGDVLFYFIGIWLSARFLREAVYPVNPALQMSPPDSETSPHEYL